MSDLIAFFADGFLNVFNFVVNLFPDDVLAENILELLQDSQIRDFLGRAAYFIPIHDMVIVTTFWIGSITLLFVAMKVNSNMRH